MLTDGVTTEGEDLVQGTLCERRWAYRFTSSASATHTNPAT